MTDRLEGCQAAARPDVDEAWNPYCVRCDLSFKESPATKTYVIPVEPMNTEQTTAVIDDAGVGIALSGARLVGPARRDALLSAHTLAPFHDCGGQVNPHAGYHYHAVTDCATTVPVAVEVHAPVVGVALDGYLIHIRFDCDGTEAADLDACSGHTIEGLGYYVQANDPAANANLPCHTPAIGCAISGEDTQCDAKIIAETKEHGKDE